MQGLLEELSAPEGEGWGHRDAEILLCLPGVGPVVSATMLSEAAPPLGDRDDPAWRMDAGVAPVTRQSGKRKVVVMRRACHPRLREAVYHRARTSVQKEERGKRQYAHLRAQGQSHGRALRGVADRNLAMLMSMLKSGTLYDAARRGGVLAEAA